MRIGWILQWKTARFFCLGMWKAFPCHGVIMNVAWNIQPWIYLSVTSMWLSDRWIPLSTPQVILEQWDHEMEKSVTISMACFYDIRCNNNSLFVDMHHRAGHINPRCCARNISLQSGQCQGCLQIQMHLYVSSKQPSTSRLKLSISISARYCDP